ncbi:hypothetical protein [Oxynema aestuarii]|uniref:Uncharacterized protein n=1 Tax=Oxynema aestuarii AP17 TaxID=2064643 RepID=A0A6H1TXY3_9CYAN|nr:hypothetical protein [Oxynema aestuarii]QIZ71007.1 hypothetical protein HCG48_10745 [Oxynema aestuarii AP17]RMH78011.1 MAG: hypothetical protein D6680_03430 [Cyanobacteria bacterium J007]
MFKNMFNLNSHPERNFSIFAAILGGLLFTMSTSPRAAIAETRASEKDGERANAEMLAQRTPLPRSRNTPVAAVPDNNGEFSIRLINSTAAPIKYQVVGDTEDRFLMGDREITLTGLEDPVTVTFQRQDDGLLQAETKVFSQEGILEITLDETTALDMDRNALRVDESGWVYLN